MRTAGAEAQEPPATLFDDDDGSVSSTDNDVTDDDEQDGEAAPSRQPPTQAAGAYDSPPTTAAFPEGVNSSIANPAVPAPPNPICATPQNGTIMVHPVVALTASSDLNPPSAAEDRKSPAIAYDESRRLFQRLWTDDDEIKILQGFLEFTSKRGTTFASHQYDTGPFYEEIKKQLDLGFTKNQLIEKLRRLKKKFRNCCARMHSARSNFQFRSAHERSIYDIAKNIWNPSIKRARDIDDDEMAIPSGVIPNPGNQIITVPINEGAFSSGQPRSGRASRRRIRRKFAEEAAAATAAAAMPAAAAAMPAAAAVMPSSAAMPSAAGQAASGGEAANFDNSIPVMHTPISSLPGIPSVVEETVKSCLSPLFKELINSAISGGPFSPGLAGSAALFGMLSLSLGGSAGPASGMPSDAKWREQKILELEVYLKRIELMRDQIKMTLEELKSSRS